MGPWSHGAWNYGKGDRLGDISFGTDTAETLRDSELRFFRQYLKDAPPVPQAAALMFETGSDKWNLLGQWPPAATAERLYLQAQGKLSFKPPSEQTGFDEYVSDPANPVPYLPKSPQNMVPEYMTADQRFLNNRKDVLSYATDPLIEDMTLAGAGFAGFIRLHFRHRLRFRRKVD